MIISKADNFLQPAIQSVSFGDEVMYQLIEDYCYEWTEEDTDKVKKRYRRTVFANKWITDLASVPDLAAPIGFRKLGTSDGAATLHDREYQLFGFWKLPAFPPGEFTVYNPVNDTWGDAEPKYWKRVQCDRLYQRMCIAGGMPLWRAEVEFWALRFGAISKKNGLAWFFS